jgi:hypothetical protein
MATAAEPLPGPGAGTTIEAMTSEAPPPRPGTVLAWATAFGLVVDLLADGPPGAGVAVAAAVGATGLVAVGRPRPPAFVFLGSGLSLVAWTVVRASPVLAAIDLATAMGLFALAAAYARGGDPVRTELSAYLIRALAWTATVRRGAAWLSAPFVSAVRRPGRRAFPRALALALPVGLVLLLLLASADAVFAAIVRTPFEAVPVGSLPAHAAVVGAAAVAFATVAARAATPLRGVAAPAPPEVLRQADRLTVLATVDVVFASFVAVQVATFFGGRGFVLARTDLTFAEHARSGFWQMLAAAGLTGLVLVVTWVAGLPLVGRALAAYRALATATVALTLVVLAGAFRRLVLYETEFGYTWPRLLPHVAILLTGALLLCGLVAIASGRTRWLPTAALVLGFVGVVGLNALDPERFIAERNLARAAAGHELDAAELASLSADAAPPIAEALPRLDGVVRADLERHLACLRDQLRDGSERFGWGSFNVARDTAAARLATLSLPPC